VAAGADVGARDEDGSTPLDIAVRSGNAESVAALVAAGPHCGDWLTPEFWQAAHPADVTRCLAAGADVGARDKWGRTALHYAAGLGTAERVAALVAAGADVGARDDEYGATPLHYAARFGTAESVAALLAAGADVGARLKDGRYAADLADDNTKVRNADIYRTLNEGRQ